MPDSEARKDAKRLLEQGKPGPTHLIAALMAHLRGELLTPLQAAYVALDRGDITPEQERLIEADLAGNPLHEEAQAASQESLLLDRARYARRILEPHRRRNVWAILRDRWQGDEPICSEEAILKAAGYSAARWWEGWLHDGVSHGDLALLAAEMAPDWDVHHAWRRALVGWRSARQNARNREFWGQSPRPAVEPWPPLRAICTQPEPLDREHVAALIDHPDLAYEGVPGWFLPRSLCEHLRPGSAGLLPPASETELRTFLMTLERELGHWPGQKFAWTRAAVYFAGRRAVKQGIVEDSVRAGAGGRRRGAPPGPKQ